MAKEQVTCLSGTEGGGRGGVDSLNHLLARWDKFELIMESHQHMVKEHVTSLSETISSMHP